MQRKKSPWWSRALWIVALLALAVVLYRAFQGTPVIVDTAKASVGKLSITVRDDGRTRVRERYSISAPILGRLLRTSLRPGDPVRAGETNVAEFAPTAPELLDARSRSQAEGRLRRSKAALEVASARVQQAKVDQAQAAREQKRVKGLREGGVGSEKQREEAEHRAQLADEALRAAEFSEQVARYERDVAAASLRSPSAEDVVEHAEPSPERPDASGRLSLRSPIDGTVLRVFEESARTLSPGAPILEVGNTARLEIVADFLSQNAVRVQPNMRAIIDGWSDASERTLRAAVRVVEPGGFTKTSALGVEEQRVNIILDPVGDAEIWSRLGDGYHVDVAILIWEGDEVLSVPTGALFRRGSEWRAYVVTDGVARERTLEIGKNNGLRAQVLSGLQEGDEVVLYPNDLLSDGSPVELR